MRRKSFLLTLLLCLCATSPAVAEPPGSAQQAAAEQAPNQIVGVSVDERDDGTWITISGSHEPTYSVFKLQAPLRLFVDISNATIGDAVRRAPISVQNGVVSQVAVLDFADEVQQVTRVIVGFDSTAPYDVRTVGNDIVVVVEGKGRTGTDGASASVDVMQRELQRREAELERARRALLEKERQLTDVEDKVSALEGQLKQGQPQSAALVKSLEAERAKANELRKELSGRENRMGALQGSIGDLERKVDNIQSERDQALSRAKDLDSALKKQQAQAQKLEAELESLKQDHKDSQAQADGLRKQRDELRARADQLAKERDAERTKAEQLAGRVEAARTEAARFEKQLADARKELDANRADSQKALARASELRDEITQIRQKLGEQDLDADKARRSLAQLQSDLERERARAGSSDADKVIARLEADKKQKEAQLAETERRLQSVSDKLADKEASLDKSIAQVRLLEDKKRNAQDLAARVEAQHRDSLARTEKAEGDQRASLERSQQKERDRLEALAEARKAEERRLETARDARVAQDNARKEAEARLADIRAELDRQQQAQKDAEARLADARGQLNSERSELDKLRKERVTLMSSGTKDLSAEKERLEKQRDEYTARVAEAKKTLATQQAELESLRKNEEGRLADTRKQIAQEQAELDRIRQERVGQDKAPGGLNTIRTIRFQENDGVSRVIIEMDRPGDFNTVPWEGGKATLQISGVSLPTSLERSLDTRAFGGTVNVVNSFQDEKGVVHVEAQVPTATTEVVRQEGNRLYWEFSSIGGTVSTAQAMPAAGLPQPQGFTSEPPRYLPAARSSSDSRTPVWQQRPQGMARKRLTIDLRGADIENVLRLLAKEGNVNIVAGNKVKGTVTMRLQNVPVTDAFVTILKSLDLGYEQDGEVIRVAEAKLFEEEAKRRQDAVISGFKLDPLEVVLVPINYANAAEVGKLAEQMLSGRGSATVDERTNTLIVKDVAQNIAAVQQLILSLDTQTPQILIEARIVETNDRFVREIGVQWGGDFLFSPANGNPTGLAFPSVVGVAGAANDGQAPVSGLAGNPNFAVNLPAPIGTGSGGGLGITLGSVGGAANLSLRLSALEENGHIKIVSSPKILTLDNRQAKISQGTSIPISVVSAAGVQTVFVEARLELNVQPHVTQDGNIQLQLNITKSEPDFENTGARGDPTIIRKEATTELLLGDGDTTVIGGIYSQTTGTSSSSVPFFGDIPILGFFFRDYSESEARTELLIFVTPRIVNREAAISSRRLSPIDAPQVDGTRGGN